MFETKRKPTTTASVAKNTKVSQQKNAFIAAGTAENNVVLSGNGAKKYSTSGDSFTDQFAKLGNYKAPRTFATIAADCEILWSEDPLKAVKFIHYLRTIPRIVNLADGSKTNAPQKGTELKHEAIMRMLWLHNKSPETFWKNIIHFISLGSWHDIFTMMQYDLSYHSWNTRQLNWDNFGDLILCGLNNPNTSELIKKYLPQIKSRSACKTIDAQSNNEIAKFICSLLFGNKESPTTYKQYRKLKTSGTAHEWQKLISQSRFNEIDFNSIHGRALSILVKSKFLKKQGLEDKYKSWIGSDDAKVKTTSFVHELFEGLSRSSTTNVKQTIDKQFNVLVEKARTNEVTDLIVVRDTSGSMSSHANGTKSSCFNVAKALALYFSEFLKGRFVNNWIEFNSRAKMNTWSGSTASEKWINDRSSYVGSTDFQSVIDLFCTIKKSGVPESEFPKGILCISDSEFNPSRQLNETNIISAKTTLTKAGFSKEYVEGFIIVLWNLQSGYYGANTGAKFETGINTKNCYYFSGYSASAISFLSKKIEQTFDVVNAALDQEILNKIEI